MVGMGSAGALALGASTLVVAPAVDERGDLSADEYARRITAGRTLLLATGIAGALAITGVLTAVLGLLASPEEAPPGRVDDAAGPGSSRRFVVPPALPEAS
jgi:hypothetical protein